MKNNSGDERNNKNRIMMKELKIRFYEEDKGWCRELREIFPEKGKPRRFLVRLTGGPGGRWLTGEVADSEPGVAMPRGSPLILFYQKLHV